LAPGRQSSGWKAWRQVWGFRAPATWLLPAFCRSAPSARKADEAVTPQRRGRALSALLQRVRKHATQCDVPRGGTSRHTSPCVAVRGGRSGPAGVPDRTSGTFRPGRSPLEKPGRPSRTGWAAGPASATRGALLFGYFLLGKQEKVTRAAAAARKPAVSRGLPSVAGEPGRDNAWKNESHWMTREAHPFGTALRAFRALRTCPA
jgi:hypothetical protein